MADQKAHVPDDAVANVAESREVNEQAFIEQGGQRAVEICGPGKFPELLDQAGRRVSGTEEIGKDAETVPDLAPETQRARLWFGQFLWDSTLGGDDETSRLSWDIGSPP